MPNWCWTSYVAVGDKKDIRDLYKKMKSLENSEKSLIENGFGNTWLGNLVTILGGDYHKISCRGEFGNLSINHNYTVVRFDTMTAWGEFDDLRKFIQFKYPSVFIYYRSEEPGMGYYGTNDVNVNICRALRWKRVIKSRITIRIGRRYFNSFPRKSGPRYTVWKR